MGMFSGIGGSALGGGLDRLAAMRKRDLESELSRLNAYVTLMKFKESIDRDRYQRSRDAIFDAIRQAAEERAADEFEWKKSLRDLNRQVLEQRVGKGALDLQYKQRRLSGGGGRGGRRSGGGGATSPSGGGGAATALYWDPETKREPVSQGQLEMIGGRQRFLELYPQGSAAAPEPPAGKGEAPPEKLSVKASVEEPRTGIEFGRISPSTGLIEKSQKPFPEMGGQPAAPSPSGGMGGGLLSAMMGPAGLANMADLSPEEQRRFRDIRDRAWAEEQIRGLRDYNYHSKQRLLKRRDAIGKEILDNWEKYSGVTPAQVAGGIEPTIRMFEDRIGKLSTETATVVETVRSILEEEEASGRLAYVERPDGTASYYYKGEPRTPGERFNQKVVYFYDMYNNAKDALDAAIDWEQKEEQADDRRAADLLKVDKEILRLALLKARLHGLMETGEPGTISPGDFAGLQGLPFDVTASKMTILPDDAPQLINLVEGQIGRLLDVMPTNRRRKVEDELGLPESPPEGARISPIGQYEGKPLFKYVLPDGRVWIDDQTKAILDNIRMQKKQPGAFTGAEIGTTTTKEGK